MVIRGRVLAPCRPVWQGSQRSRPYPIGRFSHPARRCRSSVVEHPLGKGEVVSSILTGSTRHAPICGLFVLTFSVTAQTERRTYMGKIRGLCSAHTLNCPATAR